MKYSVLVSDTITLERKATLQIEADSVEEAEEKAIEQADNGTVEWDEEQIDNTPYEATVEGLVAGVGATFTNVREVQVGEGDAGDICVLAGEIWSVSRIDENPNRLGDTPTRTYFLECVSQDLDGNLIDAAVSIDHDDDELWQDFKEIVADTHTGYVDTTTVEVSKSVAALIALRDGMRANGDAMDDRANDGRRAKSPDGDDYNVLFDLVQDALAAAGIPYRED